MHTGIPDRAQVGQLLAHRGPSSVSVYVATDPTSTGEAERIEFKNLSGEAIRQLRLAEVSTADIAPMEEEVADLIDDDMF